MTLPNVFIVGAPKSGTNTLCHFLDGFHDVIVSDPKEPELFCSEHLLSHHCTVQNLFLANPVARVRIDASMKYSIPPHCYGVPERISQHVPDAKIIYIMREPVSRCYSHFLQSLATERNSSKNPSLVRTFEEQIKLYPGIIEASDYLARISCYVRIFGDSNILFLTLEQMVQHPTQVEHLLSGFLRLQDVSLAKLRLSEIHENSRAARLVGQSTWQLRTFLGQVPLVRRFKHYMPEAAKAAMVSVFLHSLGERLPFHKAVPKMLESTKASLSERFIQQRDDLSRITGLPLWDIWD